MRRPPSAYADLPSLAARVWHYLPVGGTTGVASRRRLAPLLPARLRALRRPRWWEEVLFVGASYYLYSLVRNGVPSHQVAAVHNGVNILSAERTAHLEFEHSLNHAVASVHWLAEISNYWY